MHALIRKSYFIYGLTILISFILSIFLYNRMGVLNPDAVCYLQSAEAMQKGVRHAMQLCDQAKWPVYSYLIYWVKGITHLSMEHAAFLLNAILTAMTAVLFVSIIRLITPEPRLAIFGLITFFCAHLLNSLNAAIIRDHGYWAFYLCAIYFLIRYLRAKFPLEAFKNICFYTGSLIIATLFRVEGLLFLVLFPWFACRFSQFFQLILIPILGGLLLYYFGPGDLSRLAEVKYQLMNGAHMIHDTFYMRADLMAQHVIGEAGARDATQLLFLLMIIGYSWQIIANFSLLYLILYVFALAKRCVPFDNAARTAITGAIVINIIITAIFYSENFFLSKRYLVALYLMFYLSVPFALNHLWLGWRKSRPIFVIILAALLILCSGLIQFGPSKTYVKEAGDWLAQHVPKQAKLYSNDYQLMYYSNHFGVAIFKSQPTVTDLLHGKWKQYDYIAIRVDKKHNNDEKALLAEIRSTPIEVFGNTRGDCVRIYRRTL